MIVARFTLKFNRLRNRVSMSGPYRFRFRLCSVSVKKGGWIPTSKYIYIYIYDGFIFFLSSLLFIQVFMVPWFFRSGALSRHIRWLPVHSARAIPDKPEARWPRDENPNAFHCIGREKFHTLFIPGLQWNISGKPRACLCVRGEDEIYPRSSKTNVLVSLEHIP